MVFLGPRTSLLYLRLVPDVVRKEGEGRVALVPDAAVDDAAGQEGAGLDRVLGGVEVLVDL